MNLARKISIGIQLLALGIGAVGAQPALTNWNGSLHSVLRVQSVEGWHYIIRHGDTPDDRSWKTWIEFTAATNGQFLLPDLKPSYPKLRYYSVTNWRVFGTNRMDGVIIDRTVPCFAFHNPDPSIAAPRLVATSFLTMPFTNVLSSVLRDNEHGTYIIEFQSSLETNRYYRLELP